MNIVLNPPTNIRNRMSEEVGKLFVGAVSPLTTGDAFRAYFESFGRISDCVLMMDRDTGKNKGYGFVKYEDPRCAEDVLSAKSSHMLDGKRIDVKACTARGTKPRGVDDQRTKKVFVGGISQQANKEDLRNAFREYGMVEDVHIMIDNDTGKHRGFGFVTLDSEEAVEKLVRMHHLSVKGKSVEIKKAMPKVFKPYQSGPPGGPGGPDQMGGGYQQGGGGGNWNQGGQPGYSGGPGGPGSGGGFGGGNQWNMGQPLGQYGQQQGGFQQRGGPGGGPGFGGQQQQQQGFNNGYRPQGQGGQPPYGQQGGGGYGQQQQQQHPPQQQNYGGKPDAGGDTCGNQTSHNGGQGYGNYGNYGQQQPQPPQQQYGNQGSMGNYPQEASGYGPQRVNYNQQQGYNQGQFGNNMPGQNFGPPQQQQQQQPPPHPPQQQQQQHHQQQQQMPPQGFGQQGDGGPGMYGNNNFGRGNMGGGNQFHPYRRFQGNQI